VRWVVKGNGGTATLPDVSAVCAAIVLGAVNECAALQFNPPAGSRQRCGGDSASFACR
jgi:hypothetical protein